VKECNKIVILCGGYSSSEREISLKGGEAVCRALADILNVVKIHLDADEIPVKLDPKTDVIFPILHGEFGEDGQLQRLLETTGFGFAGSDSQSSALCMNKLRAKTLALELGINTAKFVELESRQYEYEELCDAFSGHPFVLKPVGKGSSIGVHRIFAKSDWLAVCGEVLRGDWFVEEHVRGREITVPILGHKSLPMIEIMPKSGFYDYRHKYVAGMTEYIVPAKIDHGLVAVFSEWSEKIYANCGCRDFGRIDFILSNEGVVNFLEINTIPGMTATSLFPKSAAYNGLSFQELCVEMIMPVLKRSGISLKNVLLSSN
jgi:D-alanine-D-alanine ligase